MKKQIYKHGSFSRISTISLHNVIIKSRTQNSIFICYFDLVSYFSCTTIGFFKVFSESSGDCVFYTPRHQEYEHLGQPGFLHKENVEKVYEVNQYIQMWCRFNSHIFKNNKHQGSLIIQIHKYYTYLQVVGVGPNPSSGIWQKHKPNPAEISRQDGKSKKRMSPHCIQWLSLYFPLLKAERTNLPLIKRGFHPISKQIHFCILFYWTGKK